MRPSPGIQANTFIALLLAMAVTAAAHAQSPSGPIPPQAGAPVQAAPAQTKIVSRVALVNTPVTVRDKKGQMVNSLSAADFQVTDNGVKQTITHFDMGGDPVSLVILIENSSRIQAMLPEIQKTGILLTNTVMGSNGQAAVLAFSDAVDKLQDFTTNHELIEKTVQEVQPATSGSRLYDAMAVGVEMLSGRPQASDTVPGRRVLLILAEAQDIGSDTKLGAVLRQAQLANISIYAVGLSTLRGKLQHPPKDTTIQRAPPGTYPMPPMPGTVQNPSTEDARYGSGSVDLAGLVKNIDARIVERPLEVSAAATGGAYVATVKDRSIENAIDEIGGELHSQYSISYTPTGTPASGYHEINVRVNEKGLKVRSRPGYYIASDNR